MRILITGACGFVGSTLARALAQGSARHELVGIDNFVRPGSESNRAELKRLGVKLFHGDLRVASDLEPLPACDWVVDAAANPSVLAGVDGRTSSRQLVEHNLGGTVNLLEHCKRQRAGLILLSTSRVYSIAPLAGLPTAVEKHAFRPVFPAAAKIPGLTAAGIDETFATAAPVSLYGATKLASEALALEYGEAFGLPVFINRWRRAGRGRPVRPAGPGDIRLLDQHVAAVASLSSTSASAARAIRCGDCLHPRDLVAAAGEAIRRAHSSPSGDRVANLGGGAASATSLRQLSDWCGGRLGAQAVTADPAPRPFDVPWLVLDPTKAGRLWQWRPQTTVPAILEEIAAHAEAHPDWLELSAPL